MAIKCQCKRIYLSFFLEEINNVSELYSDVDEEESSGSWNNICGPSDPYSELYDTGHEEEDIVNKRMGRKRMRLFSCSEDEFEENEQNIET